jgi:hypothetical protein
MAGDDNERRNATNGTDQNEKRAIQSAGVTVFFGRNSSTPPRLPASDVVRKGALTGRGGFPLAFYYLHLASEGCMSPIRHYN